MGKWVVVADLPCNAFFKSFSNCLIYRCAAPARCAAAPAGQVDTAVNNMRSCWASWRRAHSHPHCLELGTRQQCWRHAYVAPVSVLPGRPACTCVRLPSAAPARPARRTPEEFGAQLRRALAEEPAPMAPQERRALTWEAATERFLDVAELTEAERPRGLGAALEAATYAAVNTLSGARPRPCLRPRVRAGGRCGFCPTRGSLRSGELGAAPAAPSRRLRVRLSCSQLSRQAGGCAASCCAASWRRRAQSGRRRGGAADHGRRRPGHARQPGLADGLCARYRRQRRHLRQQGARRRAHAPVRRARLMI